MDTKEAARQKIADLVTRFRNTPAKQRDHYNEQQTREYFILPLFRALGWDTENPAEMSAEEQISRGFVDFGFYLNGVVKFYLETKKVSSDLNRPENVKQAINYAWIKGVTWAVLTDFEGLKVLNAEWQDNPERAVVLDLQFADFAEKAFDDLWLLSKESMLSGELDKVAEKFHLKIKKLPVNQYLLSNLTNWRKELFAEIRGWDKSLWATDARAVDNAIQRLLDRLIFIRTVEDRGIENRLLQPLMRDTRKGKNLFKEIQSLFRQLDDIYNATLFADDKIDYLEVHNPGLITKIVNGLYDVGGGTYAFYDFNAIDADVLGAIYEQYLGYKAIDPDAKQAIDFEQEKRRKRKSQGIYYTPQFVVRYIVQNTLGKLLETGVDPYSLRIVDPACGSGSFLIEAFDVLDKWIRTHGSDYDRINHRSRRMRILRECIYGVDLDEQAVEVARLNLLLRATGERGKLPLLTNIRRGNSLISDPTIAGDAAFDWQTAFPEVFEKGGFDVVIGNPPYIRAEKMSKTEREYWQNSGAYEVVFGRFDIFILFIEKAIKILRHQGELGFIIPQSLKVQNYAKLMRQYILENTVIESIVDFGQMHIFAEAAVETMIMTLKKDRLPDTEIHIIDPESLIQAGSIQYSTLPQSVFTETPDLTFRTEMDATTRLLLDKVDADYFKMEQICYVVIGAVPHDSESGASKKRLISDQLTETNHKLYLEGKEMGRYFLNWQGRYLLYQPDEMHRAKFPELFENEKLIVRNISGPDGLMAVFDENNFYANDTVSLCLNWSKFKGLSHTRLKEISVSVPVITAAYYDRYDLKYLLGIINSKLCNFYYHHKLAGGLHVYPSAIRRIPIRTINFDDPADKKRHDDMVQMVEMMLALKPQYAAAEANFDDRRHLLKEQIEELDTAIDRLVYELYGLTEAEIALVEGR